jgi:hypothetical protein
VIGELLRRPGEIVERCREPGAQVALARTALLLIIAGGALFGAALGTFRGSEQIPLAAAKIPIATLMTLAVCAPGFAAFVAAFGRRWSQRETLAIALSAGGRASLVLFALAPVLWLSIDLGAPYHSVRLLAAGAYALAGLSALAFVLRAIGSAPGRLATTLSFVGLFLIVGAQSAWLLRPYLGDPGDARVPVFAHGRREGGVVHVLLDSIENRAGRRP